MQMRSAAVWTEGGGHGKTILTAGTLKSLEMQGLDVLGVDLDGQKGGLSAHYGLLTDYETSNGNDFLDFLLNLPEESVRNLVKTRDGVDFLPSTRRFRDIDRLMEFAEDPHVSNNPQKQLQQLIEREGLYDDYDMMLVDLPKEMGTATRMGLYATRNVIMPMTLNTKGELSIGGIIENLHTFERGEDDVDEMGIATLVLNEVNSGQETKVEREIRSNLEDRLSTVKEKVGYHVPISPVEFFEAEAIVEGAWTAGRSPFNFYAEEKERQYSSDRRFLYRFELLAEVLKYHLTDGDLGRVMSRDQAIQEAQMAGEDDTAYESVGSYLETVKDELEATANV